MASFVLSRTSWRKACTYFENKDTPTPRKLTVMYRHAEFFDAGKKAMPDMSWEDFCRYKGCICWSDDYACRMEIDFNIKTDMSNSTDLKIEVLKYCHLLDLIRSRSANLPEYVDVSTALRGRAVRPAIGILLP